MSRHILLSLEFDGTDFAGWQRQDGQRTVQACLEAALDQLLGEPPARLRASSRLDAGVHARGLPVMVTTDRDLPLVAFERGLNSLLPADLAVTAAVESHADFDVRRSAIGKEYRYTYWNRRARSPLRARTSWHAPWALDLEAMRAAAPALLGEHDFQTFRAAGCEAHTTIRRLSQLRIEASGQGEIVLVVVGNAFLQHMVRIIAGSLFEVGRRRHPPDWLGEALAARDRAAAGQTAPARGLTLWEVLYPQSPWPAPATENR